MKLEPLKFAIRLSTGKDVTFVMHRQENRKPKCTGTGSGNLTPQEEREYLKWRNHVVATAMSVLTPQEVFATAIAEIKGEAP